MRTDQYRDFIDAVTAPRRRLVTVDEVGASSCDAVMNDFFLAQ